MTLGWLGDPGLTIRPATPLDLVGSRCAPRTRLCSCAVVGRAGRPMGPGALRHALGAGQEIHDQRSRRALTENPMFRGEFQAGQHCEIPLAEFWEWPQFPGRKTPTRIDRPDGNLRWSPACGTVFRPRTTRWGHAQSSPRPPLGMWSTCMTAAHRMSLGCPPVQ